MEIKGDFLGFKFGPYRSEELGIVRVSNGDRYEDTLLPEIKDVTVDVPGMDGEYFFGSTYGKRNISISIAFDNLTEEQLRKIKVAFGRKTMGELIFDELPYKRYIAKIEHPIELSYVCFDSQSFDWDKIELRRDLETGEIEYMKGVSGNDYEYRNYTGTTQRIYKGEGTIDFVCYFPFAKSVFKILPEAQGMDGYDNLDEWAPSSKILDQETYNNYNIDRYNNGVIKIYNAGDIETGFRLYCPFPISEQLILTYRPMGQNSSEEEVLTINPPTPIGEDEGIVIDTERKLILGVVDFAITQDGNITYTTTGNLYNQYIDNGYMFKLQPNTTIADDSDIIIEGGNDNIQIFYDYLYF